MKTPTIELEVESGDETLMDDLVHHHPDALEQLQTKYGAILRAVVLRVVHDDADADEVMQDIFVQVWSRVGSYSAAKGKPLGWLITLARRRAIDRLRQRGAYRRATDRFELEARPAHQASEQHTVEAAAFRDDLREYLHGLIDQLPPAQKQALEMAFFQEMSQRQIAATARLPLGTVKTRIELGLRKLSNVVSAARDKIV